MCSNYSSICLPSLFTPKPTTVSSSQCPCSWYCVSVCVCVDYSIAKKTERRREERWSGEKDSNRGPGGNKNPSKREPTHTHTPHPHSKCVMHPGIGDSNGIWHMQIVLCVIPAAISLYAPTTLLCRSSHPPCEYWYSVSVRELQLHGESTHPLEKSPHPPSFVKPLLHLFIHYMQVYEDVWGVYECATLGMLSFCSINILLCMFC